MKRPWMPLYIADFLKKTTHLGAIETGAYILLIMDYWQNGKLPADDRLLARVAKLTDREWKRLRPVLQAFFYDGWKHQRIDEEIAHAADVSGKRAAAAATREASKRARDLDQTEHGNGSIDPSNDDTLHTTQRKKDAADAAPDPEKELFDRGRQVLGKQGGGLVAKLLVSKNKNVALARAAIEQASTKSNPREYLGRIINGQKQGEIAWLDGIEGVI